jgi:hypothetical protein
MRTAHLPLPAHALAFVLLAVVIGAAWAPAPAKAQVQPPPAQASDGTYYLTTPGTYSGDFSCPGISPVQHCVNLRATGITLQDFTIATSGSAIQADSYSTFSNGTIAAHGGISAYAKTGIVVDGVVFKTTGGAIGLFDESGQCEGLTTKRSYYHVIQNSTFTNQDGHETIWVKCSQAVSILNNTFRSGSQWSVSLPDSHDVWIHGNVFNLTGAPSNWLAVELPRAFNVWIAWNWFIGSSNGWAVWPNSGTNFVTIEANCIVGVGVLLGDIPTAWIFGNGAC